MSTMDEAAMELYEAAQRFCSAYEMQPPVTNSRMPTQLEAFTVLTQRCGIVTTEFSRLAASIARDAISKDDYWRARDYLIRATKEHEPLAWRTEAIHECHRALERIERAEFEYRKGTVRL